MNAAPQLHWPAEALRQAIAAQLPGFGVEVLPRVDSTNTELMRRARAGHLAPTLLVAEQQTAGRGRLGRSWHSGAACAATGAPPALTFSLALQLAPQDWSGLSLAVGVCVAEALQPQLPPQGSATPAILLKWPNDLWLQGDRKLGGILVETAAFGARESRSDAGRSVIVGVGINLLPLPAQGLSTPPASLSEVAPALDAPTALARIAPPLVQALQGFAAYGFAPFAARFAQRDCLRGRDVLLSDGTEGTAHGVADDGALHVMTATGLRRVASAEISVRPRAAHAS